MRKILFLLLILAALAVRNPPARAASPGAANAPDPNGITVAWSNLPPWRYWEHSEPKGRDVALFERLAQRMGTTLRFASCDFADCLDMLKQGTADLGIVTKKNPEREQYLEFLEPPIREIPAPSLFTRPGQRPVTEWRDIHGKTIVSRKGAVPPEALTHAQPVFIPVNSAWEALGLVLSHKADLALLYRDEAHWWMERMGLDLELTECPLVLDGLLPVHLALSRASGLMERKEELEKALAALVKPPAEPGAQP